ncbi:Uncharacterized protein Adt_18662 [Abeliophyllum distichum]|uniref:CCHC-type domain-containing protein n=1 Tax=Abeliophyllum distichum TaxID=126358 RepID=A0ABD1TK21_9LAMI
MSKLPEPYNNEVMLIFNEAIEKQKSSKENFKVNLQIDHSLGLAITITRNLLAEKCKEAHLIKTSKVVVARNPRICCNQYLDRISGLYGCLPEKKQNKRRQIQKPRRKNYKIMKYKQPYKKKFFRKKKYFKRYNKTPRKGRKDSKKEDKKKFCPQKKKNCRCWLCNKIGHYVNECPAKIGQEDRIKMLKTFEKQGFYPVEDPSDMESLYYLTTDT